MLALRHRSHVDRSTVLAQPLHSAASLLAQMELHGIASAKTVAPPDEVADAATAPGEAPDAATLRPPQGAGAAEGVTPGTAPMPQDAAAAPPDVAAAGPAQEGPARQQQQVERPSASGGGDGWQSQPPPASGLLSPFLRDVSGTGEPSTPTGVTSAAASFAVQQEPTPARRTGSGGAPAQQLPDLGSGFGPADVPLRRSASDAGASGSWPPFDDAAIAADSAVSAGGSGRHGSDELPGGGGGRQLRSRSAVPAPVGAHAPLAPASLFSLAGAVLSQRCGAQIMACSC